MANGIQNVRLEIIDLKLNYGSVVAVDRASLRIPEGSITALVGPSGCGKTSLLRAIAGFERPCEGTIRVAGVDLTALPPEKRSVGMVFQEGALFPHLNVEDNIAYGVPRDAKRGERVQEAMAWAGVSELRERYPDQLSGGQQQRVALARALAPGPKLVLLDEPFASLDAEARETLRDDVCRILREASATALIVTHDQEEALSLADHVGVMQQGQIQQFGTPAEIYDHPQTAQVAKFVGSGQLLPCTITDGELACLFGVESCGIDVREALLLIRAEDLIVGEGLIAGEIIRRRFYGHDQLCSVRLDDGSLLEMRGTHSDPWHVGDRLCIELRHKRYPLFAHDGMGARLGELRWGESTR